MSQSLASALQLLVNALVPFAVALGIVTALLRLLRPPPGRLRLAFLLLPFAKLLWDLLRGIPDEAFLWAHLRGVVRESGSVLLGAGPTPPFGLQLQAVMTANTEGVHYGLSLGDVAVLTCDRLAPWCVAALVCPVVGVSAWLVGRGLWATLRFNVQNRKMAAHARIWRLAHSPGRSNVQVLVTPRAIALPDQLRVPYMNGLLHPTVVFPSQVFEALTPNQREAVLRHELAHVAHHHLAIRSTVEILACLFWFVPGVRYLARTIAYQCELMADDEAAKSETGRLDLAAALVTVGELLAERPRTSHAMLVGAAKPQLAIRVQRLVDSSPTEMASVTGRRFGWLRLLAFLITAQTVLLLAALSNA